MDVIRDVTGDEAKLLALQFLGQNIGEMKELDKQIVSSLKPLTSTIDPNSLVRSIPQVSTNTQQPVAQQPVSIPQQSIAPTGPAQPAGPIVIPSLASLQTPTNVQEQAINDPNQLELNFNSSPYSEQIFNKLDALERKITNIIETQQEILDAINIFKKKSRASATISL